MFTTDWVVRYLIDNSVGRYWIERNPSSMLVDKLDYFVKSKDGTIKAINEKIIPQDVTVLDPCVGSGHFLIYAFDVLMKIYVEYGYSECDAAAEIVKNNLFGLDIDSRASQLAYFSVMMKARQYDRRFFAREIQPHIYEIIESNTIDRLSIEYFCGNDSVLKENVEMLLDTLKDAKEYGAILQMPSIDFEKINERFEQLANEINMYNSYLLGDFQMLIHSAETMSGKYAIVATNPPYFSKYDEKLRNYIGSNYSDFKGDLFSVFIYECLQFCKDNGYASLMTPNVWMFIKTYEKLRNYIINNKTILTLIQMAKGAFFKEATVDICAFVIKNKASNDFGVYFKLDSFKGDMDTQNIGVRMALQSQDCDYLYYSNTDNFKRIPGHPIAYWVSERMSSIFLGDTIKNYSISDGQIKTSDNNKYLRYIWEVSSSEIGQDKKWVFIVKGGLFRRWYGNLDTVINWSISAREFYRKNKVARIVPEYIWWKEGVCWNHISSKSEFAIRKLEKEQLFETGANALLIDDTKNLNIILGYLNSKVAEAAIHIINPTLNSNIGDISVQPFRDCKNNEIINKGVIRCIELSKMDWDSFETSWNFLSHPLVSMAYVSKERLGAEMNSEERKNAATLLSERYRWWEQECVCRFSELKKNEEELNRIFIDIYGLQDELTPEVEDKDVTVRKADLSRDIRSFISYAVGCMFGRYSIYKEGLIYAGGKWNYNDYENIAWIAEGKPEILSFYSKTHFFPDQDNIIPICDDEYFADDIVQKFIEFVSVVYGTENLHENIKFIANALGGKGQPKDVIRNYFLNDFYADHLKVYQKRPIYWLFDSGKKNGFKCLIYMHRYQPDTIARIRTDYVHEQQSRYRTAIADLEQRINGASTSERVKLNKQLTKLQAQAAELREYEEKIHHLADQMISIDLDDGVKHNYEIFKDVLAKIK